MRYIVLRTVATAEGKVILYALTSITQKASGAVDGWIEFSEAKTNCIDPAQCDLLSFEDKDQLEEDLESWNIAAENVAIIGVQPG